MWKIKLDNIYCYYPPSLPSRSLALLPSVPAQATKGKGRQGRRNRPVRPFRPFPFPSLRERDGRFLLPCRPFPPKEPKGGFLRLLRRTDGRIPSESKRPTRSFGCYAGRLLRRKENALKKALAAKLSNIRN